MILSVKSSLVGVLIIADRVPVAGSSISSTQGNICRQRSVDRSIATVDGVDEPLQFLLTGDLVHTGFHCRFAALILRPDACRRAILDGARLGFHVACQTSGHANGNFPAQIIVGQFICFISRTVDCLRSTIPLVLWCFFAALVNSRQGVSRDFLSLDLDRSRHALHLAGLCRLDAVVIPVHALDVNLDTDHIVRNGKAFSKAQNLFLSAPVSVPDEHRILAVTVSVGGLDSFSRLNVFRQRYSSCQSLLAAHQGSQISCLVSNGSCVGFIGAGAVRICDSQGAEIPAVGTCCTSADDAAYIKDFSCLRIGIRTGYIPQVIQAFGRRTCRIAAQTSAYIAASADYVSCIVKAADTGVVPANDAARISSFC